MIFVIKTEMERNSDALESPRLFGPFRSHQDANAWMQNQYDQVVEDTEFDIEHDDSDASNFYAIGDDMAIHWHIVENAKVSD